MKSKINLSTKHQHQHQCRSTTLGTPMVPSLLQQRTAISLFFLCRFFMWIDDDTYIPFEHSRWHFYRTLSFSSANVRQIGCCEVLPGIAVIHHRKRCAHLVHRVIWQPQSYIPYYHTCLRCLYYVSKQAWASEYKFYSPFLTGIYFE